ncbi:MAG: hypothetical protein EA397_13315 [Deltaproteobacteria bacterium]|nr:MAG: hypothetical protein EA397_13315 [Deltaproteobacteria bacterium]
MSALLLLHLAHAGPATVTSTEEPISIDGRLDEEAWAHATPVTEFTRFIPTDGGPPPGRTEVRFLQDAKNLYLGVRVTGADYDVRARISRREDVNADDQIGLYLDTFQDQRTGYMLYFNARGIQQDLRIGPGFTSMAWDTVMRSKGLATDDGYTLEVAIPWRSIKYPRPEGEQTWGLILTRKIPAKGAKYSYPSIQRGHPRLFTQAGELRGVQPAPRGSGVELIPSLTLVQQASRDPDGDLSWVPLDTSHPDARRNWLQVVRPSLDGRFGITPNTGIAATINPDFSQVDQDPTFIDLNQRWAFYLPERRPFFLDGIDNFADQHQTLYTRSIVDPVYGLKVSGREGPITLGVLNALDRAPMGTVHERGAPGFSEEEVEGTFALTDLARIRIDAFGEGYVGLTFVDKRLFDPQGKTTATHTGGGADLRVPLGERWNLDGRSFQAWTGRTGERRMWGQELGIGVHRAPGIGLGMHASLTDITPGLRRETGFLNQSGISYADLGASYTFEPGGAIDTLTPGVALAGRLERNGENQQDVRLSQGMTLGGIHHFSVHGGFGRVVEGWEEDAAGQILDPASVAGFNVGGSYRSELSRLLALRPTFTYGRVMDFSRLIPADALLAAVELTLRPTPGVRFDTLLRADQLARADGTTGRAGIVRHWTTWQLTQALGVRSLAEFSAGNERDNLLVTSILLTWLHDPWTSVHLGWVERTAFIGSAHTLDRSIFLKASVLIRP